MKKTVWAALFLGLALPFFAQNSAADPQNLPADARPTLLRFWQKLLADSCLAEHISRQKWPARYEHLRPDWASLEANPDPARRTRFLIVVTVDGLRWQEVFGGADSLLLAQTPDCRADFWANTPAERRALLMPFLWETVAAEGQLHGNRWLDSRVNVANRRWFSYPGYNEIFGGQPDDERIFSNLKIPNPNASVFEFLSRRRGFRDRVAAFASWDVFSAILPEKRGQFMVNAGFEPVKATGFGRLNQLSQSLPRQWGASVRPDVLTFSYARKWLAERRPRVLLLALGETDEYAHEGKYDAYLRAARQTDICLRELWTFVQSSPKYRDRTTLLVTTDHGRGRTASDWQKHNARVPGSDEIWFAAIGPDTPALGEVHGGAAVFQQQFAQTFARLLGQQFECEHPVAPAIEAVFRQDLPLKTEPQPVGGAAAVAK